MRDTFIFALALSFVFATVAISSLISRPVQQDALYPAVKTQADALDAVQKDGLAMIDINRADEQTLTMLNGIGEVLAARIVQYRDEHGPFQSLEDLIKVKGIGEATVERIRERAIVGKADDHS